ncbi:MAG: SDR family oxidoreductase [Spirochaetaceae bacterium]|nr:SDR family oxidoreductase [Myxococcales bacterium]MCB9725306.1 SDR family oxidoreductase [Spirochaetaceae bacterium]HPG25321.1 SDR family oxidoreductase [Myxococcota bacterium]
MTRRFEDGFAGRVAVVTGGGDGIGAALVRRLTAEGCDVATCDVVESKVQATAEACAAAGHAGTVLHRAVDIREEAALVAFREAVAAWRPHVNLLCNIAGIGGGGSFVAGPREEWERTFETSWLGVYYSTRAFLPLLLRADAGQVVNMSSVKAFWASRGPGRPHSAYSTAKAAIKGFTESLITDFATHAPHLRAAVVFPGHVGTSITLNTLRLHRGATLDAATERDVAQQAEAFRESAPLTPDDAARIVLDGVRRGEWRILVGEDAAALDRRVRADPTSIYDEDFEGIVVEAVR